MDLRVARGRQLVEGDGLDVVGVHHVLAGIPVVVPLVLQQRVKHPSIVRVTVFRTV